MTSHRQARILLTATAAFVLFFTGACSDEETDESTDIDLEDTEPTEEQSDDGGAEGGDAIAEIALAAQASLPPERAECVVDGLEEELDVEDLGEADEGDIRTMMRIMLECSGVSGVSDCFVDEFVDISGIDTNELDAGVFVEAAGRQTPESRVELVQAGLICQGAPPGVAECVTDTMTTAFGEEVFESEALVLSPEQQAALEEITLDCAANG